MPIGFKLTLTYGFRAIDIPDPSRHYALWKLKYCHVQQLPVRSPHARFVHPSKEASLRWMMQGGPWFAVNAAVLAR